MVEASHRRGSDASARRTARARGLPARASRAHRRLRTNSFTIVGGRVRAAPRLPWREA
jgi:hypothetical protein